MKSSLLRCALISAALIVVGAMARSQPIGAWYGTTTNFNGDRIARVSGGVLSFGTAGHTYEGAIAVAGDVRTINFYPTAQGTLYDLAMTNLGTNYTFGAPGRYSDGTTDGSFNYTVDSLAGNVYRLDRNWQNASLLFSLGGPVAGGITYNHANGSLLIAGSSFGSVGQYLMDGTQISGISLTAYVENLAYDVDGTLWVHYNNTLNHFSTSGSSLSGSFAANLNGDVCHGGEINVVPEPATLAALGAGLFGLIARRRESKR